jgi:hypothetical protein
MQKLAVYTGEALDELENLVSPPPNQTKSNARKAPRKKTAEKS